MSIANKEILSITPYRQGKGAIENCPDPIKLSSNESCFGPSPAAIAAYHELANALHRYPDGSQVQLRQAIAATHGLDVDNIICGNGSEELLGLAIRTHIRPGDELLLSENHFIMCPIYGKSQGAQIALAAEKDFTIDVDSILSHLSAKTRIVIIANPNNPTGTYIPGSELRRLHKNLPANVLFIIDNAYCEYVKENDYADGMGLVEKHDNVMVTRTFSKIYGLAGLRIGWAYCKGEVLDVMQRLRTPFNANAAAMAAAAAAIKDVDYVNRIRDHNHEALTHIHTELPKIGLHVIRSVANFYLLNFNALEPYNARDAASFLESRGIIPRPAGQADSNMLRITVGLEHENNAVIAALTEYMQAGQAECGIGKAAINT